MFVLVGATISCDPPWSHGDMFGLLANILAYVFMVLRAIAMCKARRTIFWKTGD